MKTSDLEARVAATEEMLRAWVAADPVIVLTGDSRVTEKIAGQLLGYSETGLRTRRLAGSGPNFYYRSAFGSSRYSYRLHDLAMWLERGRDMQIDDEIGLESLRNDVKSLKRR